MDEHEVKVGNVLPMPYTTFDVRVLEIGQCDGGHRIFRFRDPVFRIDCWAHINEFTNPGPMPLELPPDQDYM